MNEAQRNRGEKKCALLWLQPVTDFSHTGIIIFIYLVAVLLLFPGVVLAQTYSGIDKEEMQESVTCIHNIDK